MTRLYTENLESGTNGTALTTSNTTFNAVTGTALTFYNTVKFQGSLSMKLTSSNPATYGTMTITSATTHYVRFYYYVETRPVGSAQGIAAAYSSTGPTYRNYISQTVGGFVALGNATVTGSSSSTTALTVGTWYRMEWDITGATQALRIYSGDNTSPLETVTNSAENAAFDSIYFGNTPIFAAAGVTVSHLWDAIAGDSTANPGAFNTLKSAADTGTGADAASVQSLLATKSAAETGQGTEATVLAVTSPGADTASSAEASSIAVSVRAAESGTLADSGSASIGSQSASASDSGHLSDNASSVNAAGSAQENGVGTESTSVAVTLSAADSGTVTDSSVVNKHFFPTEFATSRDAARVAKSTWRFTPPSHPELYQITPRSSLFIKINTGYTVLKTGGSYVQVSDTTPEAIAAADAAYLGGRSYAVDAAEIAALTAAGYGAYVALVPDPS